MNLDGVILIEAEDSVIANRFKSREASLEYDPSEMRMLEHKNAEQICIELGIRLKVLNSPSENDFELAIMELMLP